MGALEFIAANSRLSQHRTRFGLADLLDIPFGRPVSFFQGRTRITRREPLLHGLRERNEAAGKPARAPFGIAGRGNVPAQVRSKRRLVQNGWRSEEHTSEL